MGKSEPKEIEKSENQSTSKGIFATMAAVVVTCVATLVTVGTLFTANNLVGGSVEPAETGAYHEITDEDANIDNCEYVKFSSFFTKDLDGDGYAEKYDGVCNPLDKKQTLWFDINVLTDGTLKNGKVSINGINFDLQTMIVRDEAIKQDYIGKNTTEILLNDMNAGSQKLFSGIVLKDIGNNSRNYSRNDNTVTLTGTWVSSDGTRSANISKTFKLTVDWYGKTATTGYPWISTSHYIEQTLGEEFVTLSFDVGYRESAEELLLQKQITEVEIPDYNGYAPEEVTVTSQNCTYVYNYETRIITITREATVDSNGNITKSVSRDNVYNIQVKYPIESYQTAESESITLTFPTKGYYYGFNNSNEVFDYENPYVSSATRAWTHTWRKYIPVRQNAWFGLRIGRYVYNPDTGSYRYIISKEKPLKIYNEIGLDDGETDEYTVEWEAYTGETFENQNGIHLAETDPDKFRDKDAAYTSIKDYMSTTGIYFSNLSGLLEEDGWLKVYDIDTGMELLNITSEDFNRYNSNNPYKFNNPVKSIRVETSKANNNTYLHVYQIKEIDDEYLTENFTREQFDAQEYVYTYMTAGLFRNEDKVTLATYSSNAYYEAPVSLGSFSVSPEGISNQETKTLTMRISAESSRYNEAKWKDGVFVIELPEEILDVEINSVTSSNGSVTVTSYETYEENGRNYIKIYTSNQIETTFSLTISADVTADSRKATTTKSVKLYAINNNCHNYRDSSRTADVLDINNDSNTSEYVLYKSSSLTIIAPPSLLTSQTLSNFDDKGTEVVSPKIAILDKASNARDARVNMIITNNYTGTVSETTIIGKIPFAGNKFQINGGDIGSTYSVTMKNTGITLPASIASTARVYYSTNEVVTNDLSDSSNNWKLASEITDWTRIRTFAIDLSDIVLQKNDTLTFSYDIQIPANINYNDISYSTHAVYFCLDTEDGKLRSKTEVSRLGIMIAKKYELDLTKFKKGTNGKVKGATYKITEGSNTRTGVTNNNGMATVDGLYVDKEYTLKEIATPDSYILNTNEVKFKIIVDNNGNPVAVTTGELRRAASIENIEGKYILNLEVEDEAKYDIKLVKTGNSGEKLKGVKYKLTGGVYGSTGRTYTTNADGEISMINLIPGTSYTLQETKATGYYVKQSPMTFTVSRNSSGNLVVTSSSSEINGAPVSEEDGVDKATVNFNLVDEKIPTYTLKIMKQNGKGEGLANTQFKLTSVDTGTVTYVNTNSEGIAEIEGLYRYVNGKYVTGEYVLQELVATSGYITDQTEIKFKAQMVSNVLKITVLQGEEVIKESSSTANDITFTFENKAIFKLIKKGDNGALLPNAKFIITDLYGYPSLDVNGQPIGIEEGKAPMYFAYQEEETYPWTRNDDGIWQSGNKGISGRTTSTLTSKPFTIDETSTLTFDWALSAYTSNYMYYTITNVDTGAKVRDGSSNSNYRKYGVNQSNFNKLVFNTVSVSLQPGTYTISFSYYRYYDYTNSGLDTGYVKNARIAGDGYYYLKTDSNGEFSANLPTGMYKVIEIEVPEGYDLPENEEERTWYIGIGASRPEESEFTIKWSKTITGLGWSDAYDTVSTRDKGYIICGSVEGQCDLNQDGVVDITSVNSFDGLVLKYDKEAKLEWYYTLGSDETTEFKSISETQDGYVVVGKEGRNGVIVKLNSSGALVWKKDIAGTGIEELKGVKGLASGDIVVTGRTNSSTLTLGTDTLTNRGLFDGFVVCYGSDGTYKWYQGIQGTNNINVTDVEETSQGIVVAADFLGTITVNGDNITAKGSQDSILIGYSTSGNYNWHKQIGGNNEETIVRLMVDNEDSIWALGGFSSNLTVPVSLAAPSTSYANGLAMRFSSIGEYISNYSYGGSAGDDMITSATSLEDGGILLGGWYSSSSFDTDGDDTSDVTSNKGLYDGILIKMNDEYEVEWTRTIQGDQFDPVYGVVQLEDESFLAVGNYDSTNITSNDSEPLLAVQGYMDIYMINIGSVVTAAAVPALQEIEVDAIKWTKTITGLGWSDAYDAVTTRDKGYIVCGSFEGSCDLNADGAADITSVNSFDGLILKYNKRGKLEWYYTLGSDETTEFKSISETQDGYVAVGKEGRNGVIVKLNKWGALAWKKDIAGTGIEELKGVKGLASGDIVVTGRTNSSTLTLGTATLTNQGLFDGFVVCYGSDGTYKWYQGIQGTNNINVTDVEETSQGIVVAADFLGTITVNGANINAKGSQDSILIGYSTSGNYNWHQQIGGNNEETIVRLMVDNEDSIWALGGFSSNLTVPVSLAAPNTSYANGLAMRFSSIGEYISNYCYGGSAGDDLITSATPLEDGGIILGGWYSSSSFDTNRDGINDVASNKGLYDGILIKMNDEYEVEWTKTVQGDQFDPVYAVVQLEDNSLVAIGNYDSTNIVSNGSDPLLTVQGYMDIYMINFGTVTTPAAVATSQEIVVQNDLKEFRITTEIAENSEGERIGGTITGTPTGDSYVQVVEKVKYGYNGETPIVITPDENYSIYSIEMDSEKVTTFTPDENGVVTIPVFENVTSDHYVRVVFEKNLSSVLVHHYLKDRSGQYTTTKLAEDDYITGKIGESYTAMPNGDIEGYDVEKNGDGSYKIPSNATGVYEASQIVVNYYYEELPVTLTVHHYLEGTEEKLATDDVTSIYKGENYETSAKEELLNMYDVIEDLTNVIPDGAGTSGTMQTDTVVTYYYKLKEYNITTKVNEITITRYNPNTDQVEEMTIRGGTISGENENPYETVRYGANSVKTIKATPDEGYKVKRITVNDVEISFTQNQDKSVTLSKFTNVREDKKVEVEFEPITGKVVVHHYIQGSTARVPLADGSRAADETKTGYVGDPYATKANENVSERYELVSEPENSSGNYTEQTITVTYYYKLVQAKVVVHHYIEGTTTSIADDEIIEGYVGDAYNTTAAIVPEKYELMETPENATGRMTREPIEVIYYYSLKQTSVIVHYYLKNTTAKVSEDVIIPGQVDDSYQTSPANDISEEYELVSEPDNKEGTMTVAQTVVIYYYKYKAREFTVNYLEKGTNRMIHLSAHGQIEMDEEINLDNFVIEIQNFRYDSIDNNSGILNWNSGVNVINIYYVPQGYIKLRKYDADNEKPLQGAVFGIYSDKDARNEIERITTGEDGIAKSEYLDAGTYYIKEITPPDHYKKVNEIREVTIKSVIDKE